MATKVCACPEVWSIPVVLPDNPLKILNSYVIRVGSESLIIDTGFRRPECRAALWDGIRELKLDMRHTSLFLTHLHSDHIGLVHDFLDAGCPVYINEIDYAYFSQIKAGLIWPYMEELFRTEGYPPEELLRQDSENQARLYAPEKIFQAITVQDGYCLRIGDLQVHCIHTPGHTPGHTVLYLPDAQLLFSGDHILFDITPNISVWKNVPHSLADYLASLDKLTKLPVKITLPAHRAGGQPLQPRIKALQEHHRQRLSEIHQVVYQHSGLDAYSIAAQIRWSARGRPWTAFSPHQTWFAIGETLAHLYYLLDERLLGRQTDGQGIWHYYSTS